MKSVTRARCPGLAGLFEEYAYEGIGVHFFAKAIYKRSRATGEA
jgi:hypothetical protein